MRRLRLMALMVLLAKLPALALAQPVGCDKACLENFAEQYRVAYLAHDPTRVAIAPNVRFSENFVEMPFPDGTWDTVSEDLGPVLVLSDPLTSQLAIFTAIMQNDTPGFLAVRLRIEGMQITEIEHVISTRRNLSSPPTPIGDHENYVHDPVISEFMPIENRLTRAQLEAHARGYFATLHNNTGEIRGTCFTPEAIRRENGLLFTDIEGGFRSGRYLFNNEVRNWPILVDEDKGVALSRGFIDHKGVLDEYTLTDGTPQRSVFREPQTWGFLEMFKVKNNCIASVVATFVQSPYKMDSPWNRR
jgi:hypothetical protein